MPPDNHFDLLIVGAGPAGLAAALAASTSQKDTRIALIDENQALGGQIWRQDLASKHPQPDSATWLEILSSPLLHFIPGARVISQPSPRTLLAETPNDCMTLSYNRLILAPGARERFLPFPGWTLPNVMGAGALQALVKSGLPIAGKTVVVAGSGPLLLAVAAYLYKKHANIPFIAEQAPRSRVLRFALGLLRSPDKLSQALQLKLALRNVPYHTTCWPVAAQGVDRLESVTLTNGRHSWTQPCDYLACGFGLVPNTELPRSLGCQIRLGSVVVDETQATSVPGILCAGEATGIGGLEKSLLEGSIAGHSATGRLDAARALLKSRKKALAFAESLERTFALRPELKALPTPETIVCRCEDVPLSLLLPYSSSRAAKLQTRCGMGPCQGRICGPALEFLLDWPPDSIRPPIFPTKLGSLAATAKNIRNNP